MCVILACPCNVRPNAQTLRNCERANPHGAGVAWREDGEVWWMKGLDADELADLIERIEGEIVMHFRWASVGEVTPKLCHPFPVTPCATTRLTGRAPPSAASPEAGACGDFQNRTQDRISLGMSAI